MEYQKFVKYILPFFSYKLQMFIYFIYGNFKYKKSYSENGEDLILIKYFENHNIKNGVYVDIGCFHPVWISNTYLLHKKGWNGYAIDIDQQKCKYFRLLRGDKCIVQCGAITDKHSANRDIEVYKFQNAYSSIDTIDKNTADLYRKNIGVEYKIEKVTSVFICDYFVTLGKINLLNIDIEGLDELVLLNIDLSVIDPEIILFENNEIRGGSAEVKNHLNIHGYELLFISGGSICYSKKSLIK